MRFALLVAVVLVAIAVGTAYLRSSKSAPAAPDSVAAPAAPGAAEPSSERSATSSGTNSLDLASEADLRTSYASEFRDSKDLWDLTQKLLIEANSGSGAAQYYLFAILSECDTIDRTYLTIGQGDGTVRRRTLDEAMQFASVTKGFGWENMRALYERCQRIFDSRKDFGQAANWLQAAAENGFPLAQVHSAIAIASEGFNDFKSERAQARRNEARTLVIESLRSKEPEVIERVGTVAVLLAGPDEQAAARHKWVWLMAACQRGYDCSTQSTWYRLRCLQPNACQPFDTDGLDLVRRQVGTEFEELERRATQLNENIDRGRFEELGF